MAFNAVQQYGSIVHINEPSWLLIIPSIFVGFSLGHWLTWQHLRKKMGRQKSFKATFPHVKTVNNQGPLAEIFTFNVNAMLSQVIWYHLIACLFNLSLNISSCSEHLTLSDFVHYAIMFSSNPVAFSGKLCSFLSDNENLDIFNEKM